MLLSCSVFSAAAKSEYTSVFLNDLSDVQFIRWGNAHGETFDKEAYSVKVNSAGEAQLYAAMPYNEGFFQVDNWIVVIKPDPEWFYNLDESKDYHLTFLIGQDGTYSDPETSQYTKVGIALKDSNGNLIDKVKEPPLVSVNNKQYTWIHFYANDLKRLDNIAQIQIQCSIYPYVYQNQNTVGMIIQSYAWIDETDPTLDAIQGGLQDNADQITEELQNNANQITQGLQNNANQVQQEMQNQTEQQKGFFERLGDRIGEFFEKLLSGIIDGLKKLFIPEPVIDPETGQSVDYFTYYFDQWDKWMSDHFGVLYFPFAILFDTLDHVLSFTPPANPTITFPKLEIMGQTLLEPIVYDFKTFDMPWLNTAHDLYLFAVDALIGFWLVKLAYKKLTEIMGGGS